MIPSRDWPLLVVLAGLAACQKDAAAPPRPIAPAQRPAVTGPAPAAQALPAGASLEGVVAERLDAPNYTYLRITRAGGDTWAAVPTTQVPVGARVAIGNPMVMDKFESKTLNRTFDSIVFGDSARVLGEGESAPAAAAPAPALTGDPHAGQGNMHPGSPAPDLASIKVAKATGADARTVAEIYSQREALKDKPVAVRGKVVKVTRGVLGHNWLHLRDGSGSDANQDSDLVVTTTADAQVNDEVTARGTARSEKVLGAGYSFKVLVEDAQLER